MNGEIQQQEQYWDKEVRAFDSIYSHEKTRFSNFLDSVFRWDMFGRFEYTMKQSEPIKNRNFLDVGCGTGRYSLEFARRGAARVVGIDISQNMIDVCRERAGKESLSGGTEFVKSDLFGFSRQEQFDVCVGIGLFDYVSDASPLLERMRQYTRHSVILSFPRRWSWRAGVRKIRLSMKGCGVYFYTEREIARLVTRAGFKRHVIERVGELYCLTAFVD